MKQIKYLLFILSITLFSTACEKDPNGKMPDDIKDSNAGVIIVTEADPFVKVGDPGNYAISFDVDLLFEGEFEKLEVVVVMNGDYTEQNILATITSVPQSFSFTTADFVSVISGLSSVNDIAEGDAFDVFVNITLTDGTFIPAYSAVGVPNNSPSVRNIMGILKEAAGSISIAVPCAFNVADYLGAKNADEYWAPDLYQYPITVIEDPDYVGDDVGLILTEIWDGTWNLKIVISLYDYSISAPDQVMAAEVWGYQDPTWAKISGYVNTCAQTLIVDINSMCVSIGCFGGMPITYTVYPISKKSLISDLNILERPFRMVE